MPWPSSNRRQHWRAAQQIQAQLLHWQQIRYQESLPLEAWTHLLQQFQWGEHAKRHGWSAAVRAVQDEQLRANSDLLHYLQVLQQGWRQRQETTALATVPELWFDLQALCAEFPEVQIDLRTQELRVTTDAIELEGVELGRFRIDLAWTHLRYGRAYTLEALDPATPPSRSDLVHPHVHEHILCEGDGQAALRQALQQGRLLDFFLLVRQILATYNPDSAYLTLDKWYGESCQDCGQICDDQELACCQECSDLVCGECRGRCSFCRRASCQTCLRVCTFCDTACCSACLISCPQCEQEGCDCCLREELCAGCRAAQEESDTFVEDCHATATAPAGA